jgi:hypothetical protein
MTNNVEFDSHGRVCRVIYSDNSIQEVEYNHDGSLAQLNFVNSTGTSQTWTREGNTQIWYRDDDHDRDYPWTGDIVFNEMGWYTHTSNNVRTTFKPTGCRIIEAIIVKDGWTGSQTFTVCEVIYPDGSSRKLEYRPDGTVGSYVYTDMDGTQLTYTRHGNTRTWFVGPEAISWSTTFQMDVLFTASGDFVCTGNVYREIVTVDGMRRREFAPAERYRLIGVVLKCLTESLSSGQEYEVDKLRDDLSDIHRRHGAEGLYTVLETSPVKAILRDNPCITETLSELCSSHEGNSFLLRSGKLSEGKPSFVQRDSEQATSETYLASVA